MIEKLPNAPLESLDQLKLRSAITDHVRMMICGNFDRFFPDAEAGQVKKNVHKAKIAAEELAGRAIELISKGHTSEAGFEPQHLPKFRDLGIVLANAASTSVFSGSGPDGRKAREAGQNLSFISAVVGCADRVLVDMLIERK